jgi:hypothetical protein
VAQMSLLGMDASRQVRSLWSHKMVQSLGKNLVATPGWKQAWLDIKSRIQTQGLMHTLDHILACSRQYLTQAESARSTEWKTDNESWLEFRLAALTGSCGAGHKFSKPPAQINYKPVLGDQHFASTAPSQQLVAQTKNGANYGKRKSSRAVLSSSLRQYSLSIGTANSCNSCQTSQ